MSVVSRESANIKPPLPEGWIICESKSRPGKSFFFNTYTRTKQWKHPTRGPEDHLKISRKRRVSESSSHPSGESHPSTITSLNSEFKRSLPPLNHKPTLEPLYGPRSKQKKPHSVYSTKSPHTQQKTVGAAKLGMCKSSRVAAWLDKTCQEQGLIPREKVHPLSKDGTEKVVQEPLFDIVKKERGSDSVSLRLTTPGQKSESSREVQGSVVTRSQATRSQANAKKAGKHAGRNKKVNKEDKTTPIDISHNVSPNKKQRTSSSNVPLVKTHLNQTESAPEATETVPRETVAQSFSFAKAFSELQKEKAAEHSNFGSQYQNKETIKSPTNWCNESRPNIPSNLSSSSPSTPSSSSMPGFSPTTQSNEGFAFSNSTPIFSGTIPNKDSATTLSSSCIPRLDSAIPNEDGYNFLSPEFDSTDANKKVFSFGSTLSTTTGPLFNSNSAEPPVKGYGLTHVEPNSPSQTEAELNEVQSQYGMGVVEEHSDVQMKLEYDEDMDVDNAEEFQEQILSVLQEVRSGFQPAVIKDAEIQSQETSTVMPYSDTLYIVLDTNVLLSHLKFVMELRDFPVPGIGCAPVLVIPWIVTKELDSLKDHSVTVKHLARLAIQFLSSCYQANHPRVRGQTCAEAAEQIEGFEESNNDDSVLQCCLYFKKQAENGHSILFSNDVNLCNKALIHGIKAFAKENLIGGLKDLFQTALVISQGNYQEYYDKLVVQERLAKRRAKADEIICELQCILREGFSAIMETEMKQAYGEDLWEHIVYIKPPWTFRDLLQLLEKHWIAVFGQIVNRSLHDTVKEITKHFSDKKGPPSCLYHVKEVLDLVTKLFEGFSVVSNYDGMLPKCIAAVQVLDKKCKDADVGQLPRSLAVATDLEIAHAKEEADAMANLSAIIPPVQMSDGVVAAEITEENNGEETEPSTVTNVNNTNTEVLNTFNTIWSAVTQFSYQIFNALDYPHTIPSSVVPPDLQTPTRSEALQFLSKLCNHLSPLVSSLQGVHAVDKSSRRFEVLAQATRDFLKEITQIETKLTAEQFYRFTFHPSTRDSLIDGTSQLDRALGMLQHCATCLVRTSGETML